MDKYSERRLAENEVVFRKLNEQVPKGLKDLKELADTEGHVDLAPDIDISLYFYCECSDEQCRQRIRLTPDEYQELHQNNSQFVLLPGHEISNIERVVFSSDEFIVVEKFMTPPRDVKKLNITTVDKS